MSEVETTPFEDDSSLFLHDLPEEVLLLIFKNCSAKDLGSIGKTCSRFRNIIALETLWKSLCMKDYGISILGNIESYYNLYTKLLHKHGWMLGTYLCQELPYGGLLEIKYHNEEICGIQLWADSRSPRDPLTEHLMFRIKMNEHAPHCIINSKKCHKCDILKWDERHFIFKCNYKTAHEWVINQNEHKDIHDGICYKQIDLNSYQRIPQHLKLKSGLPCPQIISPGLFTAGYGSHGIEIIYFDFQEENIINGLKITGDLNVYAGKTTIRFDIRQQIIPSSLDEQRSLEALKEMIPQTSEKFQSPQSQRFIIPTYCRCEVDETLVPDRCLARYKADGQIAFHNFQNPTFTSVHVVVFNNDLLGAIWVDLGSFRFYHRIVKSL